MQWQDNYFVDMAWSFGLRSAPYIFSSVADLAEWVLKKKYDVNFLLYYLDDFHTLGPPNSQACQRNLDTCIQQFWDWRILLHPYKLEGPFTLLTVLGIKLDSLLLFRSLSAKYRPDRYRRDKSVKFGTVSLAPAD